MIDPAPLFKIIPIATLAMMSPGPDFFLISSMALSRGRGAGFLAACGIATGVLIYTLLSVFGLGIVFVHMHWLIAAIRVFGGLYLIYLGFQLWRASLRLPVMDAPAAAGKSKNRNPFVVGFLTNMTNPKALAFFTSIFALALPSNANAETNATIIAVTATSPVIWFGFVSYALSAPRMRRVYLRWSRWIDRVAGTFLALFGARLLSQRS